MDTLNLNVRYPNSDVFNRWYVYANGVEKHALKRGIVADNFVVRSGLVGYKLTLWQHDTRILLTDETDEIRGDDKGMGIQIQLGSKFLIEHIDELQTAVANLLEEIGVEDEYPINITRLDLAILKRSISVHENLRYSHESMTSSNRRSKKGILDTGSMSGIKLN